MIINEKLQGSLVRFAQHILVQVATKYMYIYIYLQVITCGDSII